MGNKTKLNYEQIKSITQGVEEKVDKNGIISFDKGSSY